jgi:formylmethanofuran dehydrogenase subunit B
VRGVPTPAGPDLEPLAERLRGSPHTVLLHDVRDHLEAFALHALVRDVAPLSPLVTLRLRRDFNAAGAEDVVTWRTGYPGAVSFAAGSPREADHLEGDVVLAVGAAVPDATISVGPRPGETARVAIATAAAGVHRAGTTHRLDGVPVPLYAPVRSDRPGDDEVLRAIAGRLPP